MISRLIFLMPRYLDDISNMNNVYFGQINPSELQFEKKTNASDTGAAFLTCICQFLMILFLLKFMINVTTLN